MSYFGKAQKSAIVESKTPAPGAHFSSVSKPLGVQCAPFGSTNPRSNSIKRSKSTHISPGPGHYNINQQEQTFEIEYGMERLKVEAKEKYLSVFKSKMERFAESSTDTPGPGSYNASPKNIGNQNSTRKKREQLWKNVLNQQQKCLIPSIPQSVNKGYKYVEGKLVRIQSSTKRDELGPGFYELPQESSNKSIIEWNRTLTANKPTRKTNFNNLLSQYRGPGRYNPELGETKSVVSSFSSKSKRYYEIQSSTDTPGPGSYQAREFGQVMNEDKHFGSKSNRFKTGSTDTQPGPGYYFKNNEAAMRQENEEDGQIVLSEKKIRINQNQTPGPGSYEISVKSRNQKTACSAIASSSSKECREFRAKQGPGPGKYDLTIRTPSFMKPVRSQSSSTICRKPEPPPASQMLYKVQNFTISHKLRMNSHLNPESHLFHPFNSGSQRFKPLANNREESAAKEQSKETKGRGQSRQIDVRSSKPSFNVSSQRSKRIVKESPGPGAYDMGVDFLKSTFNSKILNIKKI